jgi:hypothetical protein
MNPVLNVAIYPAKMAPNGMRFRLGILATKLHDRSQAAMRLLGLHHTCARGAMIPYPAIYPAKTAGFEAIRKKYLIAANRQRDRKGERIRREVRTFCPDTRTWPDGSGEFSRPSVVIAKSQ